jgi:hypothetical protein
MQRGELLIVYEVEKEAADLQCAVRNVKNR